MKTHVDDGLDWDLRLVSRISNLKDAARFFVYSLPARRKMTATQRTAVAALRKIIRKKCPDPLGGLNRATEWQWADASAQHLLDVCAAVAGVWRVFDWFPWAPRGKCFTIHNEWMESHHVLAAFDSAKRQHHAAIDALFNTEAAT